MNDIFSCAGASLVAVPTPFHDSDIDERAMASLCERQIACGSSGIVICGSTGEAPCLMPAEHGRAVRIAVEAANGRVPVIAGCTSGATAISVQLAIAAAS